MTLQPLMPHPHLNTGIQFWLTLRKRQQRLKRFREGRFPELHDERMMKKTEEGRQVDRDFTEPFKIMKGAV